MKFKQFMFLALALAVSSGASAWQKKIDFNTGTAGAKAFGDTAFNDATSATFSKDQVFEGAFSAKNSIQQGQEGFGDWGGIINFPSKVPAGGEVWFRVRTYYPSGFSFSANPWLKFLRLHTTDASGTSNYGYDDWYINLRDATYPYQFIYEGEQVWYQFGKKSDAPQFNKWETYEMYVKFDTVPASKGGKAVVRFWKDGVLIGESKDRITLKNANAFANAAYIFTYWNGGAPQTQTMYIDDVVLQTDTPAARDAQGNPYIGVGAQNPAQAAPKPPVLRVN